MASPPDAESLPDWAVDYACASLEIGTSVPGIEQKLVARGLSPEVATAVVTKALEDRLRKQSGSAQQKERRHRIHRVLSAVVGCACVLLAYLSGGGLYPGRTFWVILVSLACIWFPDEIGSNERLGFSAAGPTPAIVVRVVGWVLLLLMTLYWLWFVVFSA
jgi:hypothetical protein